MICYNQNILVDGVMLATNVLVSDPLWIGTAQGFAIQSIWSGDATGAFKLQASCSAKRPHVLNANDPVLIPDEDWADVPDSEYSVTEDGTYLWNYDGAYYPWVRLVYTNATSTSIAVTIDSIDSETEVTLDDAAGVEVGMYLVQGDVQLLITGVDTDTLTVEDTGDLTEAAATVQSAGSLGVNGTVKSDEVLG